MASFFLAPDPVQSTFFIPGGAVPGNGAQLFIYVAGSVSTPTTVYKDNAGNTAWSNPIVLDSGGNLPNGGVVWIPAGVSIKAVWAPANDTSPPASPYRTIDNIAGINDTTSSQTEWIVGPTPTFVNATQFTLVGDQTGNFQVGRRVKTTNTGGTVYGVISSSVFGVLTTVTVVNDSGAIDSGLSAVSYSVLSSTNPSVPIQIDTLSIISGSSDRTKKARFEVDNVSSGATRVFTLPDQSMTLGVIPFYLAGLTLSTIAAGSSGVMSTSPGVAADTSAAVQMSLSSAIWKTATSWAVGAGNGGLLDTGPVSTNAWYHHYLLMRPDTGVVDAGYSSSATNPPLPANYPFQRRIGSGKTDAATTWIAFVQDGDLFQLNAPVLEATATNPGTAASTQTLSGVPRGVNVNALVGIVGSGGFSAYLSDLATADLFPSVSSTPLGQIQTAASSGWQGYVRTNTSAAIRFRISVSGAGQTISIASYGWRDRRGAG
jgi:hypothetical protein